METNKRQTRAAYGCLVTGQSLWAQASPAAYRLYACSVCDTKRRCSCCMRLVALYKCYVLYALDGSIFDPLLGDFWWFRYAGSAHSVHGPSLWPARRFGTLYQTA